MSNRISSDRKAQAPRPAAYTTGPLGLTLEGAREGSPGDWLLREFAKTNAQYVSFKSELKRPWWRFW